MNTLVKGQELIVKKVIVVQMGSSCDCLSVDINHESKKLSSQRKQGFLVF